MKKIVVSPTTSSPVDLYGYGNAGRAASQAWRAMGDHGFGVREVTDSKWEGGGLPVLSIWPFRILVKTIWPLQEIN